MFITDGRYTSLKPVNTQRTIRVILVSPRYRGNVGFVCRAMANFGLEELVLVGPRADRESREARERAVHASWILSAARIVNTLEEAISTVDVSVGTTARIVSGSTARPSVVTPAELSDRLPEGGTIGIVLGPEESGLTNEQLGRLDLVVTIACSSRYPVMNLSHAAAILFYELTRPALSLPFERCDPATMQRILDLLTRSLDHLPLKNRPCVRRAVRSWVARSLLSAAEGRAIAALAHQISQAVTRGS